MKLRGCNRNGYVDLCTWLDVAIRQKTEPTLTIVGQRFTMCRSSTTQLKIYGHIGWVSDIKAHSDIDCSAYGKLIPTTLTKAKVRSFFKVV
jgi:uncharacterized protein YaaW (UPF0174 family)